MPIMVQKYGGTSVGSAERIGFVADRIVQARNEGNDVVAVVSAMGHTTDELLRLAAEITPTPEPRELDMLLTAGERIAMSLLAIAVNARGCRAASYTGSQAGIITDTRHGQAKIVEIRPGRIKESLDAGNVVILAGFQGLSTEFDITTLGRGGSDTTAVAMAAALGAEACEIYTDVDGVYTADPSLFPRARKIDTIAYEEMLELAAGGARVLGLRSVEYARKHGIRLHVRSSFGDRPGTWVTDVDEEGKPMLESALIRGVALDDQEAKVTLDEVPDRPGIAAAIFKAVAAEGIHVDMIVQNVSHDGRTDLSFTLPRADLPRVDAVLAGIVTDVGAVRYETDDGIAKLSLVGAGIKSNPGVVADMFDALAAESVNIEMISTSSIRISCVIRAEDAERAMGAIVRRFGLEGETLAEEA
jgi:aspartate kinase